MRAIGLIVICTSMSDIKTILRSIFIFTLHASDGINEDLEPTACENARRYLKQRIATHTIEIDFDYDQFEALLNKEIVDRASIAVSNFQDINHIYDECKQLSKLTSNSTGGHENMQYSLSLVKKAIRLLQIHNLLVCCNGPYFWIR